MADSCSQIEGQISLSRFERLKESLLSDEGEVDITLSFGRNEKGLKTIHGTASVSVQMQCQRCLETSTQEIHTDIHLAVVKDESQLGESEADLEPFLTSEEKVDVVALVEDDLLLAIPLVAYHSIEECVANGYQGSESETAEEEGEKSNPFAVLAELKKNSSTD